jgi:hypothetical protein
MVIVDKAAQPVLLCIAKRYAMNDLYRALGDINTIRRQVANTTEFGGYGPATLVSTAVFAVLAAVVQQLWLPDA